MIPLPLLAKTRVDLGLIAAWRFEALTNAGANNVDSIGGKVLYDADPTQSIVAGKIGNAVQLGTAGLELIPASDDFNFITNPFSIAFWFKRSAGTDTLDVRYTNGSTAWKVLVDAAQVAFEVDLDGPAPSIADAYTTPSDTWTFVCARFDATNIYLNVNARTEVSAAALTCGDQTGGTLTVTPTGTVAIDNMLIADVCWTDAQVALLAGGFQG